MKKEKIKKRRRKRKKEKGGKENGKEAESEYLSMSSVSIPN